PIGCGRAGVFGVDGVQCIGGERKSRASHGKIRFYCFDTTGYFHLIIWFWFTFLICDCLGVTLAVASAAIEASPANIGLPCPPTGAAMSYQPGFAAVAYLLADHRSEEHTSELQSR